MLEQDLNELDLDEHETQEPFSSQSTVTVPSVSSQECQSSLLGSVRLKKFDKDFRKVVNLEIINQVSAGEEGVSLEGEDLLGLIKSPRS